MLQPRQPEAVTAAELYALPPSGQGIRYFFAGDPDEEEMTYDTLAYCVCRDPAFGFADGDTIAEASSHSDAELWSDVIVRPRSWTAASSGPCGVWSPR